MPSIKFSLDVTKCSQLNRGFNVATQQFSRSYNNSSIGANLSPYSGVFWGGVILTPKRSFFFRSKSDPSQ